MNRYLAFFVVAIVVMQTAAAQQWQWRSNLQINQIALSVQLPDYPVPQGQIDTIVGSGRLPHLGISGDNRGAYGIIALTEPKPHHGYYAVRVHYDVSGPLPPAENIPVVAMELIYISETRLIYVQEPARIQKQFLSEMKQKMRQKSMTPIAFAEWSITADALESASKSPERTAPAVTPPDAQEPRRP